MQSDEGAHARCGGTACGRSWLRSANGGAATRAVVEEAGGRSCGRGGCARLQVGVVLAEEETSVPWTTRGAGAGVVAMARRREGALQCSRKLARR